MTDLSATFSLEPVLRDVILATLKTGGSGKTADTVRRNVARRLGVPYYELKSAAFAGLLARMVNEGLLVRKVTYRTSWKSGSTGYNNPATYTRSSAGG